MIKCDVVKDFTERKFSLFAEAKTTKKLTYVVCYSLLKLYRIVDSVHNDVKIDY